jgi:uncharacterized protein YjbI with pentapeptide repeats
MMEDLVELLKAGQVDEFNAKRSRRAQVDLFAADLAGAQMSGADLSGVNLEKADLSDADLSDAILARANLSGADLSNANLTGVMAVQVRLREAMVEGCDLTDADLTGADLSDAEFVGCDLTGITLTGGKAKRTRFEACTLARANFSEVKMGGAVLAGAQAQGAVFKETSLAGADLSGAQLDGADLSGARLREANLEGAQLSGARLTGADLSGARLAGARLAGADLSRADLNDATLDGVDLTGANLKEAAVPPELLPLALGDIPSWEEGEILEPTVVRSGDRVALLWEATGEDDRTWIRLGVGLVDEPGLLAAPAIPLPPDLVVARALAPDGEGFQAVFFVERPGGLLMWRFRIDAEGHLGVPERHRLPYTPATRPLLRVDPAGTLLFGISREGPGVAVHRLGGTEPEALDISRLATVRGFVSDHHPVALTKGGTVVRLTAAGPLAPVTVPPEFPGRRGALTQESDGVMNAVWLPQGGAGICVNRLGSSVETERLFKKLPCVHLDAATTVLGPTVVFTRPAAGHDGLVVAAFTLDDPKPVLIAERKGMMVDAVHLLPDASEASVAICWDDGSVEVWAFTPEGRALRWGSHG